VQEDSSLKKVSQDKRKGATQILYKTSQTSFLFHSTYPLEREETPLYISIFRPNGRL